MSTELAAPRCQAGSVQPVAVLALQLCSPALQGAGVSLPLAFPGGVVRGLALPSPGTPLVASAAPCSLCRSRSCTCLFLSGDTGTSSSV